MLIHLLLGECRGGQGAEEAPADEKQAPQVRKKSELVCWDSYLDEGVGKGSDGYQEAGSEGLGLHGNLAEPLAAVLLIGQQ